MAVLRDSRPNPGLGFPGNILHNFQVGLFSLGSGWLCVTFRLRVKWDDCVLADCSSGDGAGCTAVGGSGIRVRG